MNRHHHFLSAILLSNCLILCGGCSDPEVNESAVTTEMHEDFDHEHQHQHTAGDDHEHDHNDFHGSHAHGHAHSHRHGTPLHGGRIVSVGHSHHKDGASHFHIEILPLVEDSIQFHLLTEADNGDVKDYSIDVDSIPALIGLKGQEINSQEVLFAAMDEESSSLFRLTLPEKFREGNEFVVIVPKIKLGGQRQEFSFEITRSRISSQSDTELENTNGIGKTGDDSDIITKETSNE